MNSVAILVRLALILHRFWVLPGRCRGIPQGIPRGIPGAPPGDPPQKAPPWDPQDDLLGVPKGVPQGIPQEMPQGSSSGSTGEHPGLRTTPYSIDYMDRRQAEGNRNSNHPNGLWTTRWTRDAILH